MYSTLISDEEYDPLLVLYLTTTGAMLQNHSKAELIGTALKRVVYSMMGGESVPFDVIQEVRGSLSSKRQADAEVTERKKAEDEAAKLLAKAAAAVPPPSSPVVKPTPAASAPAPAPPAAAVTPPPPPPPAIAVPVGKSSAPPRRARVVAVTS